MEAKKGFSLSNAASSKRATGEAQGATRKVPKVADMKQQEAPRQNISRAQSNAPVNLVAYKITDQSGDVWPAYPDIE